MDHQHQKSTPVMTTIFKGEKKSRGLFSPMEQEKRVAAYCRISTMLESQTLSLETQMSVFRQKIVEYPGWKLVDIYADEGLTGTSVKKRKEFLRMIADCEAGKIDYVITKSISRFARNTLECLNYVRYLKSLGVNVLFEKENLDTGKEHSEMLLTVLASFAQEESYSISENVKWGIRKQFERGKPRWCNLYGYRKGPQGELVIDEEKAQIVRRAFELYEQGASFPEIANLFNKEGIPSPRGKQWAVFSVAEMLSNEKYKGDMMLQKYISVDHLSHKRVKNDATDVPIYYIEGSHQGIVGSKCFERVQTIRNMKNVRRGVPQYPYGETIICCPQCGGRLVIRNTHGNHKTRMVLGCFEKAGCGQFALRLHQVNEKMQEAYNTMEIDQLQTQKAESFLAMKQKQPQLDRVDYYWLDELVDHIEVKRHQGAIAWKTRSKVSCWDLFVHWRCGLTSIMVMNLHSVDHEPATVAASYWAKGQGRKGYRDESSENRGEE